jgi:phosphatidate cytidylyltransferase
MIRIVSAVALIALLVVTVWWLPPIATVVLATLIAFLGGLEFAGLARKVGIEVPADLVAVQAATICAMEGLSLWLSAPTPFAMGILLAGTIMTTSWLVLTAGAPGPATIARAAVAIAGPVYVGVPLAAIVSIRFMGGAQAVGLLAVMVIVSDSAQYFTGRAFGRRKLAPLISPAKTLEGALGGLAAAAIVGATLGVVWLPGVTPVTGALLGLAVAIAGMAGDLFESALKRGAGVKDSGALIPGHGGVLDRIDSWLFAGPLVYLFLKVFP